MVLAAASRLIRPCSCLALSLALGFLFQAVLLFFSTRSSNIVKTFLSLSTVPQSRMLLKSCGTSTQSLEFFYKIVMSKLKTVTLDLTALNIIDPVNVQLGVLRAEKQR